MLLSFSVGRVVINHKETPLANVIDQPLHLSPMIVSFYEPQIEHGRRRSRYDIASQRADVAAAYPVDVQRWLIDQLKQAFAVTFCAREAKLRTQLVIVSRSFRDRVSLCVTERLHTIVPAGNRHAAGVVFH